MDAMRRARLGLLAVIVMMSVLILTVLSLWAVDVLQRMEGGWMFLYAAPGFLLFDVIFCYMYLDMSRRQRSTSDEHRGRKG